MTVYNEISLDGRVSGFAGNGVAYYRHGFRWPTDAILMGSTTATAFGPAETAAEQLGAGPRVAPAPIPPGFEDLVATQRPLLVVVDSRGTCLAWRHAQAQPWYGGYVCIASERTSAGHLAYLGRRGVETVIAGDDHVDLAAALTLLHERFGIERVRTDGGGRLNGALLAAGVVDEVYVMVTPRLSGERDARALVELPRSLGHEGVALRLLDVERIDGGDELMLRYEVGTT